MRVGPPGRISIDLVVVLFSDSALRSPVLSLGLDDSLASPHLLAVVVWPEIHPVVKVVIRVRRAGLAHLQRRVYLVVPLSCLIVILLVQADHRVV